MEYDLRNRPTRRPPTIWRDYPLASRLGALGLGIALMVPIAGLLHRSDGHVRASGLAGATVPNVVLEESAATSVDTLAPSTTGVTEAPTSAVTRPPQTAALNLPVTSVASTVARTAPPTTRAAATTTKPKPIVTAAPTTRPPAPTTGATAPPTTRPPTTAPRPTAPPTTAAARYSSDQVVALIRELWPADSVDKALEVARLESGYRNWAYNGHCCYGVFQINYAAQKRRLAARGLGLEGLYNPRVNISIALEIFLEQGWSPWSVV